MTSYEDIEHLEADLLFVVGSTSNLICLNFDIKPIFSSNSTYLQYFEAIGDHSVMVSSAKEINPFFLDGTNLIIIGQEITHHE